MYTSNSSIQFGAELLHKVLQRRSTVLSIRCWPPARLSTTLTADRRNRTLMQGMFAFQGPVLSQVTSQLWFLYRSVFKSVKPFFSWSRQHEYLLCKPKVIKTRLIIVCSIYNMYREPTERVCYSNRSSQVWIWKHDIYLDSWQMAVHCFPPCWV